MGDKTIAVPSNVWNQISRSATVLDYAALLPPPPVSAERGYLEFRNFIATADGKPNWSGHARGFAFHPILRKAACGRSAEKTPRIVCKDDPIILHGQTGTGKTIALQALAYAERRREQHTVLYIERKMERPGRSRDHKFCEWAEDVGFLNTLLYGTACCRPVNMLICSDLAGRGRKVVLVGSSYRMPESYEKRDGFVVAPATL